MHQVTYQYYASATNSNPLMDKRLFVAFAILAQDRHVHVVHLGTVRTVPQPPLYERSKHMTHPPQAIDVQKVYIDNRLVYDCRTHIGKQALAASMVGVGFAHLNDNEQHLHVEVP